MRCTIRKLLGIECQSYNVLTPMPSFAIFQAVLDGSQVDSCHLCDGGSNILSESQEHCLAPSAVQMPRHKGHFQMAHLEPDLVQGLQCLPCLWLTLV